MTTTEQVLWDILDRTGIAIENLKGMEGDESRLAGKISGALLVEGYVREALRLVQRAELADPKPIGAAESTETEDEA